jgi:Uma2 family endonuclease
MDGKDPVAHVPAVKLTYDDFVLFPDDGKRHELIDGEHYVTASPNLKHQVILGNLHLVIASWLEHQPDGRVYLSPFDVVFTQFDVVEPDLLFVTASRLTTVLTPQNVQGSPDLVVEIASKSTRKRDETIKRRLYERSGVSEYWVIDPDVDVVRVYRLEGLQYGRPEELTLERADTLTTSLMPGLTIALQRIFRDT